MSSTHKQAINIRERLADQPSALTPDEVRQTWVDNSFIFKEEHNEVGGAKVSGLRSPQIGAIHAALGYERCRGQDPCTVVMPTGTGKTDTILSIVIAGHFKKTLVIVPSDSLRKQTFEKFKDLTLLRKLNLISTSFENPWISLIKSRFESEEELDDILNSNILIATPNILNNISDNQLFKICISCSHLIIDEAHHVKADTWIKVRDLFHGKPIFQFTATPFRTDGIRIDGKIIYNYPLSDAQKEGYFETIDFHPVIEYSDSKSDEKIASLAISLLREDLESGYDHLLMARAKNIQRAKDIFEIYKEEKDLSPILIHSRIANKDNILEEIKSKHHKIIVCVDMLGEGFDLPELKIAAIHDAHKSINITLQFIGRFTRTKSKIGNAKIITNIANIDLKNCLLDLYKEDSDWNEIIKEISENKIKTELKHEQLIANFSNSPDLLKIGFTPNISTIAYDLSSSKWSPDSYIKFFNQTYEKVAFTLNDNKNKLIFITKSHEPTCWTQNKDIFNVKYNLFIGYFDENHKILFIYSDSEDSQKDRLAKIIAPACSRFQDDCVFRAFNGVDRLIIQNLGLNKIEQGLSYTMHTGSDINDQISEIEKKRSIKSNIFAKGYEDGESITIGCSHKGKIWAMENKEIEEWFSWCDKIGKKIIDNSIDTNKIWETAIQRKTLEAFPSSAILYIDWPLSLLSKNESRINIKCATLEENFSNCELSISYTTLNNNKLYSFYLKLPDKTVKLTAKFTAKGKITISSKEIIEISINGKKESLGKYLSENNPVFFLADSSCIKDGIHYYLKDSLSYPFNKEKIISWDWNGVDISQESQTEKKLKQTIQYRTIANIKEKYDFIFDDDGSGELADIVAIKIADSLLTIDLYHCKFCHKQNGKTQAGARVTDLYEVVGQAAKCTKWFKDKISIVDHLLHRESLRTSKGKNSRIEKGTLDQLNAFRNMVQVIPVKFGINIVQPAVSKKKISIDMLNLLGTAELYIQQTTKASLSVISNK